MTFINSETVLVIVSDKFGIVRSRMESVITEVYLILILVLVGVWVSMVYYCVINSEITR